MAGDLAHARLRSELGPDPFRFTIMPDLVKVVEIRPEGQFLALLLRYCRAGLHHGRAFGLGCTYRPHSGSDERADQGLTIYAHERAAPHQAMAHSQALFVLAILLQ